MLVLQYIATRQAQAQTISNNMARTVITELRSLVSFRSFCISLPLEGWEKIFVFVPKSDGVCQYRLVTFDELELVITSNVDGTRLTFVELMSDFLAVGPIK